MPKHYSWNLGTPDNAVGTEVIVNPYAEQQQQRRPQRTPKIVRAIKKLQEQEHERMKYESSISINEGNKEVLIPTINEDGSQLHPDEAIDRYRSTGDHLGEFASAKEATAHAQEKMGGSPFDQVMDHYDQHVNDKTMEYINKMRQYSQGKDE